MLIKCEVCTITDIDNFWYNDSISVYVEDMEFHIGGEYRMMLWDYFYTPQEERKLKLENIENVKGFC